MSERCDGRTEEERMHESEGCFGGRMGGGLVLNTIWFDMILVSAERDGNGAWLCRPVYDI
jgi:hypothetical protein